MVGVWQSHLAACYSALLGSLIPLTFSYLFVLMPNPVFFYHVLDVAPCIDFSLIY